MATKQMQIEGMTCVHCEKTIAEALTSVGASKVEANWRGGRATLDVGNATDEQLKTAIEEAGYKVVSIRDAKRVRSGFEAVVSNQAVDYDLVVIGSGSAAPASTSAAFPRRRCLPPPISSTAPATIRSPASNA